MGSSGGLCEDHNAISGSIKSEKYLDQLRDYQFLQKAKSSESDVKMITTTMMIIIMLIK
jgi:hypothetical protein